jgi:hypothetical protein
MNAELETLLIEFREAQDASAMADEAVSAALDELMPPEVRIAIAECNAEMQPMVDAARTKTKEVEEHVRAWVLEHQEGGKAAGFEALYSAGRTTWDTKGLEKAMRLIPALADYRKSGDPYVTIRKAKMDEA